MTVPAVSLLLAERASMTAVGRLLPFAIRHYLPDLV